MGTEGSLPPEWCCVKGEVYGKSTQLVSGFLSEGIAPCVAIESVHPWEKGTVNNPLIVTLNLSGWLLSIALLDPYFKVMIPPN